MTSAAPTAENMRQLFGRAILFVGVQAQHWTPSTFGGAARLARSLGIDTLCAKRADGSIKWYDTPENLALERKACLAEGVGYVPFLYAYGPQFCHWDAEGKLVDTKQIHDECDVLEEMAAANDGSVVVDMETEWNGHADCAQVFAAIMRPVPCILGVTTWADPVQQDWLGVAQALAPAVNVWIPQQYDNWLAAQGIPAEETIVQPGVDLSSEFGANNVIGIVRGIANRHESAWLWEYTYALEQQQLTRTLTSILKGVPLVELPGLITDATELVAPDMGYNHAYVLTATDSSLADVATHLGLSNWYQDLYKPNQAALDTAAQSAGHAAGSSGGQVLVPGTKLNYNM